MKMVRMQRKLALILAVAMLLVGCGSKTADATKDGASAADGVEESMANGMEFAPVEPAGVAVETPYITLKAPEEWRETVKIEQKEENGAVTVTFSTVIAEIDMELFSLILSSSETGEGFRLGQLADEKAGTIYVFAVMNEDMPEVWGDEEISQFSSMQERVNDLIMQLHEDPRFDSGK